MICLFGSAQERSPATARATSASAAEATTPCAYRRFASELAITSSGEPLDQAGPNSEETPVGRPSRNTFNGAQDHVGSYWMSRHSRSDVTVRGRGRPDMECDE